MLAVVFALATLGAWLVGGRQNGGMFAIVATTGERTGSSSEGR